MDGFKNVRYLPEFESLVLNEWVFEDRYPEDRRFVCARSSGPSDYVAEWWHIGNTYQLMWVAYHELEANGTVNGTMHVRDHGTLLRECDTLQEVLVYCFTHLHPELP